MFALQEMRALEVPVGRRVLAPRAALELLRLQSLAGEDVGGHAYRVAGYAHRLASKMALTSAELEVVVWSSLFHDLGKVLVPTRLLSKPSALTRDEVSLLRTHPLLGAQLLMVAGCPIPWVAAVAAHHERWDGRGYPTGLHGDRIPLAARILAVADTFDAMTSQRAYRPPRSVLGASRELERVAGTQLDPETVEIFLRECLNAPPPPSAPWPRGV